MYRGRGRESRNTPDSAVYRLSVFTHSGKKVLEQEYIGRPDGVDLSGLPSDPYMAVLTDQKTYWIAKQFVKY
jgi:hypothetical protein